MMRPMASTPSRLGRIARSIGRRLPYLRDLHQYLRALESEREQLRTEVAHWRTWMSPGHFYSPIPSLAEISRREAEIFGDPPRELPGIDLRVDEQLQLIEELRGYYAEMPFPRQKRDGLRFWLENPAFAYSDAIYLYAMLRHVRPKRVIEIGSGFSSAAMLDTAELFFRGEIAFTFIDPDPSVFDSLAKPGDRERASFRAMQVQDVPLEVFDILEPGDILFIDSSHVSKTGSDVNRIVFDIVPRLASGVYVHFHDIHYPFEYPRPWVYEGRAWNEAYLIRALLAFNSAFEIVLLPSYLTQFHGELLTEAMPLVMENKPGSLWLRRK
jgi:hypothetical protein